MLREESRKVFRDAIDKLIEEIKRPVLKSGKYFGDPDKIGAAYGDVGHPKDSGPAQIWAPGGQAPEPFDKRGNILKPGAKKIFCPVVPGVKSGFDAHTEKIRKFAAENAENWHK